MFASTAPPVCGDGGFHLCALITESTQKVQPFPAPHFNQRDSVKVRLLNPAVKQTH